MHVHFHLYVFIYVKFMCVYAYSVCRLCLVSRVMLCSVCDVDVLILILDMMILRKIYIYIDIYKDR